MVNGIRCRRRGNPLGGVDACDLELEEELGHFESVDEAAALRLFEELDAGVM